MAIYYSNGESTEDGGFVLMEVRYLNLNSFDALSSS